MNENSIDYIVLVGSILMLIIALTSTPLAALIAVTSLFLAYCAHSFNNVVLALVFGILSIVSGAAALAVFYISMITLLLGSHT
jgi:hypothetical protein